ncbi:MAG: Sjogren's syndrome/scleroderma autoantigen 1 family protein [Nitrososphaera sp.]
MGVPYYIFYQNFIDSRVTSKKKKFACSKYFTMASSSSEDNVSRIKAGASLLASGGTLTSEPCHKCGGVQVRLGEKITCINCGNEVNTARTQPKEEREEVAAAVAPVRRSALLASVVTLIEEKVALIASEIRVENDISMQRQKAELLERYLGILEKAKSLIG